MKISGTIVEVLPLQKGSGSTGEWQKQEYILETDATISTKICFSLWGGKIEKYNVKVGQDVVVWVEIESVPFKGKWYTNVKGWKVEAQENLYEYEQEDISEYVLNNEATETHSYTSQDGYQVTYETSEKAFLERKAKAITIISLVDGEGKEVLKELFPTKTPYALNKIVANAFYITLKSKRTKSDNSNKLPD